MAGIHQGLSEYKNRKANKRRGEKLGKMAQKEAEFQRGAFIDTYQSTGNESS